MKPHRTDDKTGHERRARRSHASAFRGDEPADRDVEAVARLERIAYHSRSRLDHIAAAITRKASSATALALHAVWFVLWIIANVRPIDGIEPFDPFPFSLLTMIVSLEAIFLTLFVLITQNRMSLEADKRAQLDLQINLLAEKETTMILRILHDISTHLGLKGTASRELAELLKDTKLDELSRKLDEALPAEE